MKLISRIWSCVRISAKDALHDTRGLAATEFAMILPMMLVMLLGTLDVSTGVAINRKVTLVARTLSDLTSQSSTVSSTTDIPNFFRASYGIMWPYSSAPTLATISEVYIDPNTSVARVQWSTGAAPRGLGSTVTIPTGLIGKDSSGKTLPSQYLIFSEVSYHYTPIVGYVMSKAGINLSDTAYTRPRQLACVHYDELASSPCPTN